MSRPSAPELPLPPGVADEVREAFARDGVVRSFPAGSMLWHAGASPDGLHLVLEGEVKIARSTGGRPHVVHRGTRGAILGQVPLFAPGGYPATATAVRPTRCLVLRRHDVDAALARDPAFARHLLAGLAERVRFLVDRLDQRSARTVAQRLETWLRHRAEAAPGAWFELGVTQAELAQELGTVREVVARELARLRDRGRIESDRRGRYRVLESEGPVDRPEEG